MTSILPLTARAALLDDAADIARIYNQGIEDRIATFETEPRTTEQIAAMLTQRGAAHPQIVVERDGAVIAWAGSSPYNDRACYAGVAGCSVYVERGVRGAGAGRAALNALIAACEALGFWKLTSRIFPENTASRAMCTACGFREVGIYYRHGKLDDVWRDCVIVERLLGEAVDPT